MQWEKAANYAFYINCQKNFDARMEGFSLFCWCCEIIRILCATNGLLNTGLGHPVVIKRLIVVGFGLNQEGVSISDFHRVSYPSLVPAGSNAGILFSLLIASLVTEIRSCASARLR